MHAQWHQIIIGVGSHDQATDEFHEHKISKVVLLKLIPNSREIGDLLKGLISSDSV
jgi:hypothetical protein